METTNPPADTWGSPATHPEQHADGSHGCGCGMHVPEEVCDGLHLHVLQQGQQAHGRSIQPDPGPGGRGKEGVGSARR